MGALDLGHRSGNAPVRSPRLSSALLGDQSGFGQLRPPEEGSGRVALEGWFATWRAARLQARQTAILVA